MIKDWFPIGRISSGSSEQVAAFRRGLRELGYEEGRNVTIDVRYAEGKFDRLPWTEAGGLIPYGPDNIELTRRSAIYVDKILKGTKPGELPIAQPTKFNLVINLKTAKQIGLIIPAECASAGDRVIR